MRPAGRNESEVIEPRDVCMEQMPTVLGNGKAPVGVGYGDCAGESAGVGERGMPGNGWVEELGKPTVVSSNDE